MLQHRAMGVRPTLAARQPCVAGALPMRTAAAARRSAGAAAIPMQQQPAMQHQLAALPRLPSRALLTCRASASGAAVPMPAQPAKPAPAVGVKLVPAAISIGVGLIVNYLIPTPEGVTTQAWRLFAIFISTICGACLFEDS